MNDAPIRPGGAFVLYWMISARRLEWNHGLERAVGHAREHSRPLLILEALRCGYRWASPRLHRFCADGMAEHARRLKRTRVGYFPYLEPEEGAGKGLLEALSRRAVVVVTDDFPSFFLPRMVEAAGEALRVRLEAVDSNGILPLGLPGRDFTTARSFRGFLHDVLPELLDRGPGAYPLRGDPLPSGAGIPEEVAARWPPAEQDARGRFALEGVPLDREVPEVELRGGRTAARGLLRRFLDDGLARYARDARHPDRAATSRLSPHLHWGHLSSWEILETILEQCDWSPARVDGEARGQRTGWWGLPSGAEAFLQQLLTWRELGYVTAHRRPDHESYESLPEWARSTLEEHRSDPRPTLYDQDELERAETHDAIWNAAQRELRRTGVIHNTLRMLWGKKILEWSPSPREALRVMIELNNRWGLDGRNPNSTSGIFWTLGRYDRGWPPRPVFGTVRSMSSPRTRRKVEMEEYLTRFGA